MEFNVWVPCIHGDVISSFECLSTYLPTPKRVPRSSNFCSLSFVTCWATSKWWERTWDNWSGFCTEIRHSIPWKVSWEKKTTLKFCSKLAPRCHLGIIHSVRQTHSLQRVRYSRPFCELLCLDTQSHIYSVHIYYLPRQRSTSNWNHKAQGTGGLAWASWKPWTLWGLWLARWMDWKQQSWREGRQKKEKKKREGESIQSTGHFPGAPAAKCANEWHFQVCSYLVSTSTCSDVGKLPGLWIN